MKKLHFTKHLLDKIKIRKISKVFIAHVMESPDIVYYDSLNKTNIAIQKQKERFYMIAFSVADVVINVITVHPIKEEQIKNRIKNKRWLEISD